MKYYSSWQTALIDFTMRYGHNYDDGYNLISEFEELLNQNVHGTYYMFLGNE